MPIAGVIVLTETDASQKVLMALNQEENVTTYGVHRKGHIVAVIETGTSREMEKYTQELIDRIPGILGIFPAYVNYENEIGLPEGDTESGPGV
jgi:nitrate reductase NapAB chaperone NapD